MYLIKLTKKNSTKWLPGVIILMIIYDLIGGDTDL